MTSENRLKPTRQRMGDQPDKPAQKRQAKRKMVMRFRRRLDFTAQERRVEDRQEWNTQGEQSAYFRFVTVKPFP